MEVTVQHDRTRRYPDGTIDFDYYRAKALALRALTIRRLARRMSMRTAAVIVAMVLAVAALALSPARGQDDAAAAIPKALEAPALIG
jgi:hypothetical protein